MSKQANLLEVISSGPRMGREEVFLSDDEARAVLVIDVVFRTEDITVWLGGRTLAVMDRRDFVTWLWQGGSFMTDDLFWSVEASTTFLTIDGDRTYVIDEDTLAQLASLA